MWFLKGKRVGYFLGSGYADVAYTHSFTYIQSQPLIWN
jgi:hypothetical protein